MKSKNETETAPPKIFRDPICPNNECPKPEPLVSDTRLFRSPNGTITWVAWCQHCGHPIPVFMVALPNPRDSQSLVSANGPVETVRIHASATAIPLADDSVQCCVTSPPYWGLRKYAGEQELVWGGNTETILHGSTGWPDITLSGSVPCAHEWALESVHALDWKRPSVNGRGETQPRVPVIGADKSIGERGICHLCGAWRGGYGLEPTVEMYVAHTVQILREIRRVLRPDGVVFWNIGDSYASQGGKREYGSHDGGVGRGPTGGSRPAPSAEIKPKDLCLIPQRVMLAAQADGWWVRSDIIWAKPNPMPESCKDRPTDAYEHIIMLTKSARYYFDADAVREESQSYTRVITERDHGTFGSDAWPGGNKVNRAGRVIETSGRNIRNVWTFPTQPYSGAKGIADYVGGDGRAYKASRDCPVHGHLYGAGKTRTGEHGALLNQERIDISGTASRLDPKPAPESVSIHSRDAGQPVPANDLTRTDGNNGDHKNGVSYEVEPQNLPGNGHTLETRGDMLDLQGLSGSQTATSHSSGNRKKGRARLTTSAYTASAQSLFRTDGTEGLSEVTGNGESKTSEDSALDGPVKVSAQIGNGISGIPSCNCTIVSSDHFATFPEELPRRCIKASTKTGEVVLDPFGGSGTTGRVAIELRRIPVLLDIAYGSGQYDSLADKRTRNVQIGLL